MTAPLISVIIPCYKQAQFLAQAIESVLAQTYPNIESIVIDDGSPDNTREVVRAYPTVRLLEQENTGVSIARNNGMKLAKGQYYQFLDADDWLHPEKIATQVEYMEANPHIGLTFTDFFMADSANTISDQASVSDHIMPIDGEQLFTQFWLGCLFPPVCALVRNNWLGDFLAGIEGCEDYEMWLRLSARECPMHFINTRLAYYRQHPANASKNNIKIRQSMIGARAATAANFPEKVGEATLEVIKTLAEILESKNAWSSRHEKDFAEISSYKERLETNQASQQHYITDLETAVAQKNAHILALEQQLQEGKANNLINRIKKLKG